jgi:hypothetical protein
MQYHLRVTAERFAAPFHTARWYKVVDADLTTDLVRVSNRAAQPTQQRGASRANGGSALGGSGGGGSNAASQVCFAWNLNGCSAKCPEGRRHVCRSCGGSHRQGDCPRGKKEKEKKPAAPPAPEASA